MEGLAHGAIVASDVDGISAAYCARDGWAANIPKRTKAQGVTRRRYVFDASFIRSTPPVIYSSSYDAYVRTVEEMRPYASASASAWSYAR